MGNKGEQEGEIPSRGSLRGFCETTRSLHDEWEKATSFFQHSGCVFLGPYAARCIDAESGQHGVYTAPHRDTCMGIGRRIHSQLCIGNKTLSPVSSFCGHGIQGSIQVLSLVSECENCRGLLKQPNFRRKLSALPIGNTLPPHFGRMKAYGDCVERFFLVGWLFRSLFLYRQHETAKSRFHAIYILFAWFELQRRCCFRSAFLCSYS